MGHKLRQQLESHKRCKRERGSTAPKTASNEALVCRRVCLLWVFVFHIGVRNRSGLGTLPQAKPRPFAAYFFSDHPQIHRLEANQIFSFINQSATGDQRYVVALVLRFLLSSSRSNFKANAVSFDRLKVDSRLSRKSDGSILPLILLNSADSHCALRV